MGTCSALRLHVDFFPGDPPPCSSLSLFSMSPDPSPPLRPPGAKAGWSQPSAGDKADRKPLLGCNCSVAPQAKTSHLKDGGFVPVLNYEAVLIARTQTSRPRLERGAGFQASCWNAVPCLLSARGSSPGPPSLFSPLSSNSHSAGRPAARAK